MPSRPQDIGECRSLLYDMWYDNGTRREVRKTVGRPGIRSLSEAMLGYSKKLLSERKVGLGSGPSLLAWPLLHSLADGPPGWAGACALGGQTSEGRCKHRGR